MGLFEEVRRATKLRLFVWGDFKFKYRSHTNLIEFEIKGKLEDCRACRAFMFQGKFIEYSVN